MTKISDLSSLATADYNDLLPIVDVSELDATLKNKKITAFDLTRPFYPLVIPLSSTSWDGDYYSTMAATTLNLAGVFGVPAQTKAVSVRLIASESGGYPAASIWYVAIRPPGVIRHAVSVYVPGGNYKVATAGVCPCASNTDIQIEIGASGVGTMYVNLRIFGYWL